jgi:hypothetical protein
VKEPDLDKLAEIDRRLEEAQTAQDYVAIYERLMVEAAAACGDRQDAMESFAFWTPVDGKAPGPRFQQHLARLREQREQTLPAA